MLVPPLPSPFSTHMWSCACAPFSPYEPARLGSHDAPLSASARIRMAFFRAKEISLAITELAASTVCLFAGTSASTHYRMHHVIIVYSWQLSFCSLSLILLLLLLLAHMVVGDNLFEQLLYLLGPPLEGLGPFQSVRWSRQTSVHLPFENLAAVALRAL